MRLRCHPALLASVGIAAAVGGCAPRAEVQTAAAPPNPYGYLRPAALCDTPGKPLPTAGIASTTLVVGNDGGYCALRFAHDGAPYASFLVTAVPAHGDPLIYNYNGQTVVTYTPTAGYAGPDAMTVEFVPGGGAPRATLTVAITVRPSAAAGARS